MEEAIGRIKTYEERIKYKKGKQVDNQEKLMFTRHESKGKYFRGRGRGKHKFSQGKNHERFKEERKDGETSHKNSNRNNFKKSSYDTSKLQCYKCKKIGHIAPNCPQRTKTNEQSNLVEEDLEPTLLMAILKDSDEGKHVKEVEEQKISLHEEDVGYKEENMDSLSLWYLDNGASNHMTGVRERFKELDEKVSGKIAPKCPQKTKPNEQSNLVEEDLEPTLLMAILEDEEERKVSLHEEDAGYKETNKDSLWYLDNGASNHMTGIREHFKESDEKVTRKVRFGDGSYMKIKGKVLILIECDDEKQRIISHVYYIPDLKSNLL
nr:zinc finger, CCHC-type [Tanacetum cinerariifolium]